MPATGTPLSWPARHPPPAIELIHACKAIAGAHPAVPVLAVPPAEKLNMHIVHWLLKTGIRSCADTSCSEDDFREALRCTCEGKAWMSARITDLRADWDALPTDKDHGATRHLSLRQIEVALLSASGLSDTEVADRLGVSKGAVITHKKRLYEKAGVQNVGQLACWLRLVGLMP